MMTVDRLLGQEVMTGDGRIWTVTKVEPVNYINGTSGAMRTIQMQMVQLIAKDVSKRVALDLPLSVFIGALDWGLIERL